MIIFQNNINQEVVNIVFELALREMIAGDMVYTSPHISIILFMKYIQVVNSKKNINNIELRDACITGKKSLVEFSSLVCIFKDYLPITV